MRVQFERFDQAVNHMSHGLCAVDAEHRIVLFNPRFLEMFGLVGRRRPRRRLDARHHRACGAARILSARHAASRSGSAGSKMKPGKPFQQALNLRNGRKYVLHYHPMSDGGWVTLCEDVTERHRMERELRLQYERFDQAINHMSHGLACSARTSG